MAAPKMALGKFSPYSKLPNIGAGIGQVGVKERCEDSYPPAGGTDLETILKVRTKLGFFVQVAARRTHINVYTLRAARPLVTTETAAAADIIPVSHPFKL